MAKPRTVKKSKVKYSASTEEKQQVERAVSNAAKHVKSWKLRELEKLLKSNTEMPVCVPVNGGYIIGKCVLQQTDDLWQLLNYYKEPIGLFSTLASATAYAICSQSGKDRLAYEIMEKDGLIAKYQQDLNVYQYRLSSAIKKGDTWRTDLFDTLSESTKFQLEAAKLQLQKSLRLTKYFKVLGTTNYES